MWIEILSGLVVYKLFRRLIAGDDADIPDVDSKHSDAAFAVAARLEKAYGGRAYVGLRIPDCDTRSRQHIDVVLVTKREVMVVAVQSFKWKPETHPVVVREIKRQVSILESYLQQRGVFLPEGQLIGRIILPNPDFWTTYSIDSQPEVISFEKWTKLKPKAKGGISNWLKDTFSGGKSEKNDVERQKIHFVLSTSPTWDRVELRGGRKILGKFIEFKGNTDDMQALRNLKRSKVSRFMVQKSTLFGALDRTRTHILYSPRDYQIEGGSSYEWKEVAVKHGTEILFEPMNSKKALKLKLSSIVSVSLSA